MPRKHLGAIAAVAATFALTVTVGAAALHTGDISDVPSANTKAPGYTPPNVLSPELQQTIVAQGSMKLENGTRAVPYYGYDGNGPMLPLAGTTAEASKTEPDKNTYLVLDGQKGADPSYDYGTHFVFQGHEGGTTGYITRINLDADVAHRVTLLATNDATGAPIRTLDGSTWDPWAQRLLFTAEGGTNGAVYQATLDVPSKVEDLAGVLGRGGYEGIQNDSAGNLYIVEDVGGKGGPATPHARHPNSFIYRFLPTDKTDLSRGGKLQALQVSSLQNGQPIVFHPGQNDADITSADTKDLSSYGKTFTTRWVTVHDTAADGTAPYDANAAAKAHGATPFKRPENGQFRPGAKFTEFYFDTTGDTNTDTEAGTTYDGFGAVYKLVQNPTTDAGTLQLFYRSDVAHSGFDNVAFFSRDKVAFVEDAGDTLHTQRNALDSGYLFDVTKDYSTGAQPLRFLAQGRDPSATIDSGLTGPPRTTGFQNDGDNEITGLHVSDGDPGAKGILGEKEPKAFDPNGKWRFFYTQQHGDNVTYEVTAR